MAIIYEYRVLDRRSIAIDFFMVEKIIYDKPLDKEVGGLVLYLEEPLWWYPYIASDTITFYLTSPNLIRKLFAS